MESRLLKSAILYILMLKQQLQRISFCWALIIILQTLFIILLQIQFNIRYPATNNAVQAVLIDIWQKINDQNTLSAINGVGFICSIFIIIFFFIFMCLKKPLNQFDSRAVYLSKLVTISSFLVYIFQAFLFTIIWHLKQIVNNPQVKLQYFQYGMLPFIIISSIFVGFINQRVRIMGFFFPILLFVTGESLALSYAASIVGLLICSYSIKYGEIHKFLQIRNHNIRKCLHLMLLCFFVWKFIANFKFNLSQSNNNSYIASIYLFTILVLSFVIGFFTFVDKINEKLTPVIQLCQCLLNIEKNPQDNESKIIVMKISSQYIKNLNGNQKSKINDEQYSNIEHLCAGKNKEWKIDDWRKLINIMINQQYERQKSLKLGLDLLKCRLMIKDKKLFEILVLMKHLILSFKQQNFMSQFEIFKSIFKIQEIYFKKYKYNSNSTIHIVRQVDRLNNKFYGLCCLQIEYMHGFWSAVTMHKINLEKQLNSEGKQLKDQRKKGQFNEQFLQNNNPEVLMQKFIIDIHEGVQKLQNVLHNIKELSIANREERILDYIKFLTTYTYENHINFFENINIKNDENRILENQKGHDYSQYLQVVDSKITKISLKLATQLQYNRMEVIDQNLQFLLPKPYQNQIQTTIIGHDQPVYKVPHLVPLKCSNNSIILKNITTYLQLDFNFGYRVIFHLQNNQNNKDPILIFNTVANTIDYYNNQFINTFRIEKNKIDTKIRNKFLNPDEIFIDIQLSDKAVQNKLEDNRFQTQYNCRMCSSKIGIKKGPRVENIRLSLVEKQQNFMILRVLKGHRIKSMMGGMQQSQNKLSRTNSSSSFFSIFQYDIHKTFGKKQEKKILASQQDKLQQEQIFCKIENPYQSKINNKKSQLNKSTKITFKFYAVLAIVLAMLLLVTQGFTFLHINNQIDDALQVRSSRMLDQIDMYMKLMLAYEKYYEYTLVKTQATRLQDIQVDYKSLLLKFSSQLQSQIVLFQEQYLQNLLTPQNQEQKISYSLKFEHYVIKTDTSSTNLFDIAQNLLRYQNDQKALKFLLQNYNQFAKLVVKTSSKHYSRQEKLQQFYVSYYAISGTIFVLSMFCLIISTIFSLKIGYVRAQIQHIFKIMNLRNLQAVFEGLKSLKQKIKQIKEEGLKQQKKIDKLMSFCLQYQQKKQPKKIQKLNYFKKKQKQLSQQTIKIYQSFSPIRSPVETPRKPHMTSPPYISPISSPSQTQRCQNLLKVSDLEENQDDQFKKQQEKIKLNQVNQNKSDGQQYKKSVKIRNLGFFGYASVLVIIFLTTYLQIDYLNKKVEVSELLTNFKIQNKKIIENIIHQILQAQNYILNFHFILNNSDNFTELQYKIYFEEFKLFGQKFVVNNYKLPPMYFDSLNKMYFKKITTNLCENFLQKRNLSFNKSICSQIFNGILQFGVTKTIEQLNLNLLNYTRTNSWFNLSTYGKFSNFQQILYAEQILLKASQQIQNELFTYQNYFKSVMDRKSMLIFIIGCFLSFGHFFISFIMKKYIYKASKVGIGYFLILPKKVLLQNQIIQHLRKNDVLNRLSLI